MPSHTGEQFYEEVTFQMKMENKDFNNDNKAKKEASLTLNKFGIKGIKYNGMQDGECFI